MRVSGTVGLLPRAIGTPEVLPSQGERSRPRHDLSEGIITLADDMRPAATLLIGLSWYALQCQSRY